ncbi:MAG: ABC transporter permease, partial [Bacteroidota bacterium]
MLNLKLALRNLWKNKMQSAILIGGLTIGMGACILLLQYVSFEMSYDQFHSKYDRIYRVVNERFQEGNSVQKGTITYPTIGPTMKEEYPEIRNATRLSTGASIILSKDEQVESFDYV